MTRTDAIRRVALTILLTLSCAVVATAPARAATCGGTVGYPGDDSTSAEFANWMANGAFKVRLPSELPVMAGLVESGLKNLPYGDADSLGFFQMRKSIWNSGPYKGYAKKPELQLQWFLDQAASVRASYIKNGKGDPARSGSTYGVWIADIERPAARYRGRYQPRLKEARTLIAQSCPNLASVNVLAPVSGLSFKRKQHPARSGAIAVRVSCPKAACLATMGVSFRLPGSRRTVKLTSDTTMVAAGRRGSVRTRVPRSLRGGIRNRLRRGGSLRARLRISVAGTNGQATVRVRKIAIER
jgi:hypothetical protein